MQRLNEIKNNIFTLSFEDVIEIINSKDELSYKIGEIWLKKKYNLIPKRYSYLKKFFNEENKEIIDPFQNPPVLSAIQRNDFLIANFLLSLGGTPQSPSIAIRTSDHLKILNLLNPGEQIEFNLNTKEKTCEFYTKSDLIEILWHLYNWPSDLHQKNKSLLFPSTLSSPSDFISFWQDYTKDEICSFLVNYYSISGLIK
jgi:hypothetical protein